MREYTFQICGVQMAVASALPLVTDTVMEQYFGGDGRHLRVEGRAVPELAEAKGTLLRREAERLVYRKNRLVTRCRMVSAGAAPYARLDYDLRQRQAAALTVREETWRWATDYLRLWSVLCLPQLLLPFRTLIFHAAYIGWQGRGILFTAPSGTGKSTQAELWRRYRRAEVLNGDKAGVRLEERPMVYGVPFSGTSGICRNVSLPLRGIVVLSQAAENTIRRLLPSEAVAALCQNVFVDSAVQEEWQMAVQLLLDLVSAVPVYALACTPDERAVAALEAAMAQE